MLIVAFVAIGVLMWVCTTIYLDGLWRRRRQLWQAQFYGRRIADEAWEWLSNY